MQTYLKEGNKVGKAGNSHGSNGSSQRGMGEC